MSRRLFLFLGFLFLASTCGWAPSAGAQNTKNCAVDSPEAYNVGYTELSNQPEGADCLNFYRCYLAEQPAGPFLRKFDPACDPMAGACRVDLVVPLLFKGAHQTWVSSFNTLSPLVYWFESESPPDDCEPWIEADCDDTAVCGTGLGGQILFDRIDTFLSLSVGCSDLSTEDLRTYSLSAFSCPVGSACPETKKISGLDLSPQTVAAFLGCPQPRTDDCDDCLGCRRVGPGGASVGGRGATAGGPGTGPEALLWYASAGGAGEPGLPGSGDWNVAMGRYWSHSYAQRIVADPDDSHVWLITDRATFREFGNLDAMTGEYQTLRPSGEYRKLYRLLDGWQLVAPDGTVTAFDDDGLWLSTADRNGNDTTAVYTGTRLDEVHFADGRHELFTYHPLGHASEGKLETITEVGVLGAASRTWSYSWSGDDLVRIDRPDGTAWVMSYSTDPNLPGYLTRIDLRPAGGVQPDRVLVAWEYDAEGNVKETWRGAGAYADPQAVDRWAFAYDDPANPTETVVTDPLGDDATYTFDRDPKSEKPRVTRIEGDCPTCGLGPSSEIDYDGDHPLRPEQITDGNGNVTRFTYNDAGEVATRTDAFGHATLERTTTWTHDATFPALVESIVQESVDGSGDGRRTDVVRDLQGNEIARTVSGVEGGAWVEPDGPVAGGSPFDVTTVTEPNDAGLPLWIDPEDDGGFGTADRTEFTYDGDRGDLVPLSRTDPVVGTTGFTHDPFNRRTQVTDPNGVVTETQYDALDRVTAVIRHGAVPADDLVTIYAYDDYGDLASVTQPEGNFTEYTYDAAGRLTGIARWNAAQTAGERVVYLLDRAANRIHEEHAAWDPQAAEWAPPDSWTSYFYETRCRLDRLVQPDGTMGGAVTEYDHDCNGNLERVWDAAHPSNQKMNPPTTTYAYDARDRLISVTRPWAGAGGGSAVTTYSYDVQDHLVRVTDAEGSDTFYTYSDRDLLVRESSPVAGVTLHTYDLHGELATTTDARGVTVTRTLDAADRVTAVDHPNPLEADVAYTYDGGPFGIGRLTSITRGGVTVGYAYDRFGRLTQDGELAYGYDGNGNRTGITYPDGVTATYGYDHADRQVTLSVEHDAAVTDVVTAAGHLPNGPLTSLAFGNGVTETRGFDLRYLPDAITLTAPRNRSWDYDVDEMGNVTAIVGLGDCAGDVTLTGVTVSEPEAHSSCASLVAGPNVTVAATGDLELTAATRVIFEDGFSVADGGRLTAGTDPALSGDVTKSYGYQDIDYFLETAAGPWGTQSWTYDRIGNRLSETTNGFTDLYTYDGNGSSGNTALLRTISLGVGAERNFDYTDAGHQTVSSASGNAVTFAYDDSGRLVEADRSGSGPPVPFVYDGRSFLRTAGDLATTGTVTATYDSAGLLHSLLRQENVASPQERYHLFHLAGRPVAQYAPDTGEGTRWWFFTTDHLGTPLVATAADGSEIWENRFEPFGTDAAAGTALGALENEVFLRFPGQWEDGVWGEATLGAGLTFNVRRWYDTQTGAYKTPDPLGLSSDIHLFRYAAGNPLALVDPLGLQSARQLCIRQWTLGGIATGAAVTGVAYGLAAATGCSLVAPGFGTVGCGGGGTTVGIIQGGFYGGAAGGLFGLIFCRDTCDSEPEVCPPCRLVDGTVVPIGQIAYRYDQPDDPQHGIAGPHYNLYIANQNPNNCQCFWQRSRTVPPPPDPSWIPIRPFAN